VLNKLLSLHRTLKLNKMKLSTIIIFIELLEAKQENETITFEEQSKLNFFIERAEQLIYKHSV
jgi:hypothetical protein